MDVADISQRVIARCIDAVICVVVVAVPGILGFLALLSMFSSTTTTAYNSYDGSVSYSDSDGSFWVAALVLFAVGPVVYVVFAVLYEWLFIGLWGATLGKMAFHIRVVDQRTGRHIGLGPAFVRHLVILAPALLPYVGLLASLAVLLSPLFDNSGRLQGWHDKAANDLVIKR